MNNIWQRIYQKTHRSSARTVPNEAVRENKVSIEHQSTDDTLKSKYIKPKKSTNKSYKIQLTDKTERIVAHTYRNESIKEMDLSGMDKKIIIHMSAIKSTAKKFILTLSIQTPFILMPYAIECDRCDIQVKVKREDCSDYRRFIDFVARLRASAFNVKPNIIFIFEKSTTNEEKSAFIAMLENKQNFCDTMVSMDKYSAVTMGSAYSMTPSRTIKGLSGPFE